MDSDVILFVAVGFAAQLVDGAIGMAYGVTASAVLLSFGITPAVTSASVHTAEVFTTGASGLSHWRFGNIRWSYFMDLALPGMLGGILGAYLLTQIPAAVIRPIVNAYLLALGITILVKALRSSRQSREPSRGGTRVLGLFGGLLDAMGGGGWGPIVASTLINRGATPRFAIGTANLAEFFVTATITGTFVLTIGIELWPIILGLIIGGVIAAPFAAYLAKRLPDRPMMVLVGVVVTLLSLRGLVESLD